jgi:small membrane protein
MIIQIILIMVLLLMTINFMRSRQSSRTKAYKKLLLLAFIPCAIIVILFPDLTTHIAHIVGVGRGADLLLYGVTVLVIFQLLNNYIKDRDSQRKLDALVRKMAILEATHKDK